MSRAESLRGMGDLTGALNEVSKALRVNDQDTRARALHNDVSRQLRIAAQQDQVRQLLGKAKTEISAGRYTSAIGCLREVEKVDPESTEAHSLLQAALMEQEQDRRRKVLEQINQEIERCIEGEEWERANDLLDRALEKLPSEPRCKRTELDERVIGLSSASGLFCGNFGAFLPRFRKADRDGLLWVGDFLSAAPAPELALFHFMHFGFDLFTGCGAVLSPG